MRTKVEQKREGLATLNDEDITFFGKVVDQFGAPIAGAAVSGSIQVNNGTRLGTDRASVTTDANGTFKITGYRGKTLGINISKNGYIMASATTSFVYSLLWPEAERHVPDQNNPVIFDMWKLQGAEPLVSINGEQKLLLTGAPLFIDLLTGSVSSSGGDLQIVITRSAGYLSKRAPGDWSVDIIPVNGGIMEPPHNTSYITFAAPQAGYQSEYLVNMGRDDPAWFDSFHKAFFLKSRGGQVYSKLSLDFGINRDPEAPAYLRFRGVANTNGSRNWEATAPK